MKEITNETKNGNEENQAISLECFIEAFNAEDGLKRCNGNREFYYKVIGKILNDDEKQQGFRTAVESGNMKDIETHAHLLKGIYGSLGLRELYDASQAIFERVQELEELSDRSSIQPLYETYASAFEKARDMYGRISNQ